eukprot:PITA_10876
MNWCVGDYYCSELPQVVSVFASQRRILHTTRSIEFLGLVDEDDSVPSNSLWNSGSFGNDVIIGNLDSGVWPESESFIDTNRGDIPSKWKGTCQNGKDFGSAQSFELCILTIKVLFNKVLFDTRKLIGARFFNAGYQSRYGISPNETLSPRDKTGHGTHTLSTAGGEFVANASIFGHGEGVAKGVAPNARVAAYKVCWTDVNNIYGCDDSDILAAIDTGISDGVDVFSISIGSAPGDIHPDYSHDAIAIGSFHAVQSGRVVVCSAGNSGPAKGTVANVAPWIITVAASTIDRDFPSIVTLRNDDIYVARDKVLPSSDYLRDVSFIDANQTEGELCFPGTLDPSKVNGKIVVCLRGANPLIVKGETVQLAGGVGIIVRNDPGGDLSILAEPYTIPAAHLSVFDGFLVFNYIRNKTGSAVASIDVQMTRLNTKPAPVMATFSSQGPNPLTPDILKPDITAPGVNILAAFTEAVSATGASFDHRLVPFMLLSGTSMACPHVAGVVALLRNAHPDWSPAAIRSAIMTTGLNHSYNFGQQQWANYGWEWVTFANGSMNYSSTQIKGITGYDIPCPPVAPAIYDLNYPAITVSQLDGTVIVRRNVTNVADGPVNCTAAVVGPTGVSVSVDPGTLEFSKTGDTKSFNVTLTAVNGSVGEYAFGNLTWLSANFLVVSPIVVKVVALQTD